MTTRSALAALAVLAAAAGCGTVSARPQPRPHVAAPAAPSLATSLVTPGGSWAVVQMGGSAAQHNNFWQVFARPAGSAAWRLVTPPGVASNGGVVVAGMAGQSLLAGFRPSQGLLFSPLAATTDGGGTWSADVLDASLANVPDALAAAPTADHFLALTSGGVIEQAGRGAATWSRLTSVKSLAESPVGRRCSPSAPAAVSVTPSGAAVAGTGCARPGVAGIFFHTVGGWRLAALTLPGPDAAQRVQVLRLTRTGASETALLAVGAGPATKLLAAWSTDGVSWTASGPLSLGAAAVTSSGFGPAGQAWVLLSTGRAETIAGTGAAWRELPRPPATSAALAFGPAGSIGALAAHGSKLTVWQLAAGAVTWRKVQVINVPIQYGSSG